MVRMNACLLQLHKLLWISTEDEHTAGIQERAGDQTSARSTTAGGEQHWGRGPVSARQQTFRTCHG